MSVSLLSLDLVEVSKINRNTIFHIRYKTSNNFTREVLYPDEYKCLLRKGTASKLNNAQNDLEKLGYGLKIFDAFRPYSLQKKLWELVKDERYVMKWPNPSVHNRGASVDLTLVLLDGSYIDMGTDFDDFSEKSSENHINLPERILYHRKLLKFSMIKNGFLSIPTEWWHFNDSEYHKYDVLDYNFSDFRY
ncbi:MAG: M15 family metallopeptidase [Bacteroidales bacterium]|nr:M15 family metallopeptidase [Bacteroidales bacterium]